MATPRTSVCAPWATPEDITEVDPTTLDEPTLIKALAGATDILFQLTGRRFSGLCTATVRPLPRVLNRDHGRPISVPWAWYGGGGWGYFSGGYLAGYGYSRFGWVTANADELPGGMTVPEVTLGAYPVVSVEEVLVDGVVVDPTTYRLDENRYLVRVVNPAETPDPSGGASNPGWPLTQRIDLPATEPNTFEVTYTYGVAPPEIGVMAAAELGYQLYLAVSPAKSGQCKLPQRVTSMTREGVTAVVLDPQVFLAEGRVGLTRCDYFIESFNPNKLQRRATVKSPDIGRRVRRTGPWSPTGPSS